MNNSILTNKKLVIFDVDGTLYLQKGLRKQMMSEMLRYHLIRPHKWVNLPIIMGYRKIREAAGDTDFGPVNMERHFCEKIAKQYFCSPAYVSAVIQTWMQDKPLPFLKNHQYKGLSELLAWIKTAGIKTAVYSDLPAFGKLKALGLKFDLVVDSTMPQINALKPQPKGLIHICKELNISISDAIFVGDREDRDKACAERIQMDYLIVTKNDSFYLDLMKREHRLKEINERIY